MENEEEVEEEEEERHPLRKLDSGLKTLMMGRKRMGKVEKESVDRAC